MALAGVSNGRRDNKLLRKSLIHRRKVRLIDLFSAAGGKQASAWTVVVGALVRLGGLCGCLGVDAVAWGV
jgi:hypothetical protein